MTRRPAPPLSKPKPGAVVRCRTRRYLVEDALRSTERETDTAVAMARMEDQAIGQRLTVFLEREIDFDTPRGEQLGSGRPAGF